MPPSRIRTRRGHASAVAVALRALLVLLAFTLTRAAPRARSLSASPSASPSSSPAAVGVEYNPITFFRLAETSRSGTSRALSPSPSPSPSRSPSPAGGNRLPPGVEYIPNVYYRAEQNDDGVIYDPLRGLQRDEWHVRAPASSGGNFSGLENVVRVAGQGQEMGDDELLRAMGVSTTRKDAEERDLRLRALSRQSGTRRRVVGSRSVIVVTYGASTPSEAQRPFERSLQVWADTFPSDVEIRIRFEWTSIGGGTLAATVTPFFIPGSFGGANKLDGGTVYGSVMAASLQSKDFVRSSEHHIIMSFNSRVDWHYGLDPTPLSKWDLATTSLHEVCHGLFFSGVAQASSQQRIAGFSSTSGLPGRFDRFLRASNKASVSNVCALDGNQFYNSLTNGGLRFTDPDKPGTDFGLFSPTGYLPGSSTYHHDPDRLAADCRSNEIASGECSDLMTHKLPKGYTQRSVGAPVQRTLAALRSGNRGVTGGENCAVPAGSGSSAGGSGTKSGGVFGSGFIFPRWAIYVVAGIAGFGVIALIYALISSFTGRGRT